MIELRRLDMQEYKNYLSQQFWLASIIESAMIAAGKCCYRTTSQEKLGQFFYDHAKAEKGHHIWAYRDIQQLGGDLRPPNKHTTTLIDNIFDIVDDTHWCHTILGLSDIVENMTKDMKVEDIVPQEAMDKKADMFIRRHIKADKQHSKDIKKALKLLRPSHLQDVKDSTPLFQKLYDNFLLASIE